MSNPILWEASRDDLEASLLWGFKEHLEEKFKIKFSSYAELHTWSVREFKDFIVVGGEFEIYH